MKPAAESVKRSQRGIRGGSGEGDRWRVGRADQRLKAALQLS